MLRTHIGQRWFRQKTPAVSDSTMARSLETMTISKLRPILYDGSRKGVSKCNLRYGKLRIGILDGSSFGRFEASCFEVVVMVEYPQAWQGTTFKLLSVAPLAC